MSNAVLTRLFVSDGEQAVRIPDEFAFADPAAEVTVSRHGDVITIAPVRSGQLQALEQLRARPRPSSVQRIERTEVPDRARD